MTDPADSGLINHARRELEMAGLLDDDSEYDGMLGKAVLEIVTVFARQGHSGASAALVTGIVERLLRYDVLTPLTYEPDEWIDQGEISGYPIWQNRRKPSVFSKDYGKTHYDLGMPR